VVPWKENSVATPTRRHLLTGPATLVAGAALAACGGGAAPEAGAPAGRALKPAALDVWLWWKDPVESLQQMSDRFAEKVPGSTVHVDAPAAYWDKLTAALAGSAGPDLFFMNNVNYWAWANRGLLVDLDRLVAGDAEMRRNLDASWKDAVTYYKFQGKNYGLPK
jgi:ABC-type glycerol-3-phosphate transport system substrate-binding protein